MTGAGSSPPRLCIDANLVLRRLLPYEQDPRIVQTWAGWATAGVQLVGPPLLHAEVTSTLRLHVTAGKLRASDGDAFFAAFNRLGIRRIDRDDLYPRAWELAKRYNQRRAYDVLYVALAQLEDLELWTGDERLFNTVRRDEPRVRWLPA